MWVLARSGNGDVTALLAFEDREVTDAVRHLALLRAVSRRDDAAADLLALCLRNRALARTVAALRVSRFDPSAVELAIDDLAGPDASRRANALEALDAMGDPHIRPLVQAWEGSGTPSGDTERAIAEVLDADDPWLRAAGAISAAGDPALRDRIEMLAESDDDTLVRTAAASALSEMNPETNLQTLTTLSLIERIVFLRRVPLFDGLSPEDLKHVADITEEHAYEQGDLIAEQGEAGEEMHLIVSGEIGVRVGQGDASREVARRRAGESVGEMAVISRAPRMASLVAATDVRTLVIDRVRFERILRDRPDASLAVINVLCERLRETQSET